MVDYTVEGPAGAPVLLLINSIGTTRRIWSRQRPALGRAYRLMTYDARGHGASDTPAGDSTIADLGRDALGILDAEGVATAHVCGISLGGLTALWLGVHAPHRVRSLVVANTAARIGSVASWTDRIAMVRARGMRAVADMAMPRWFSPEFAAREPATIAEFRTMVDACPVEGYLSCCAALRDADLRDAVGSIGCPVLAVAGRLDVLTPVEGLAFIRDRVAGARLTVLDAAHLSNVEQAEAFSAAVLEFLGGEPPADPNGSAGER